MSIGYRFSSGNDDEILFSLLAVFLTSMLSIGYRFSSGNDDKSLFSKLLLFSGGTERPETFKVGVRAVAALPFSEPSTKRGEVTRFFFFFFKKKKKKKEKKFDK